MTLRRSLVFLDTEFTDLRAPELLSLGLVSLDGREQYTELDLTTPEGRAREHAAGDFARHGPVLEQWGRIPGATCSYRDMGLRIADWLQGQPAGTRGLEIGYDYAMDWELLVNLLKDAGEWEQLRGVLVPVNIGHDVARIEAELAAEAELARLSRERDLQRHHALADAWALRAAYARITQVD